MFLVSLKTIIIDFDLVLCMLDLSTVIMFSIVNLFNSLGVIVAQARREKVRRDRKTNNGHSKRAKMLAIQAKYSTNKGLYKYGPSLSILVRKNNEAQRSQVSGF